MKYSSRLRIVFIQTHISSASILLQRSSSTPIVASSVYLYSTENYTLIVYKYIC